MQLAQLLQDGTVTVNDLNWKVGDTRTINLGSFKTYSSASSTSTQAAQTAQLVIYHKIGSGIKFTDGKDVNYVIGFKDSVARTQWSESGNTYSSSTLKITENNIYNALPSALKSAFKQFNTYTATNGNVSTITAYPVYMCSLAEKEIIGSRQISVQAEANKLIQFDYFKTSNNRIKKIDGSAASYFLRSPYGGSTWYVCYISESGGMTMDAPTYVDPISPFGCI